MDPEACLNEAEMLVSAGEYEAAVADLLDAYREWRRHGGFEPFNGDHRAKMLRRQMGRAE